MEGKYVAFLEMSFDTKELAEKFLADAEELGAKMNGELEKSDVDPF